MPASGSVSAVLMGKWLSAGFLAGLLPTDQGNQMPRRRPCLWTCVQAVALEVQPGPGSRAVEERQEIWACVEHKALALRRTHHTLDVASFPSQEQLLVGFHLIEYWIKSKEEAFLFCFVFLNPDIEDFRLWLVGPIDFVLWQGRAWSVWRRKTFYLMGAKTQRGMGSHHLLQRYVPRWHIITSLAPTSWCFCHHQITKPFTWDFGNIPDPNSNT